MIVNLTVLFRTLRQGLRRLEVSAGTALLVSSPGLSTLLLSGPSDIVTTGAPAEDAQIHLKVKPSGNYRIEFAFTHTDTEIWYDIYIYSDMHNTKTNEA